MRLDKETLVPIGLAVTVVMAAATAASVVSWRVAASYTVIGTRLDTIEKKLNDAADHAVSERDLKLWMMLLKDKNKALDIPEWVGG